MLPDTFKCSSIHNALAYWSWIGCSFGMLGVSAPSACLMRHAGAGLAWVSHTSLHGCSRLLVHQKLRGQAQIVIACVEVEQQDPQSLLLKWPNDPRRKVELLPSSARHREPRNMWNAPQSGRNKLHHTRRNSGLTH